MVTTTMAAPSPPRPTIHRRICSWCGADLGALIHPSQHNSYGICEECAHRYFANLYDSEDPPAPAPPPGERQRGND